MRFSPGSFLYATSLFSAASWVRFAMGNFGSRESGPRRQGEARGFQICSCSYGFRVGARVAKSSKAKGASG